ncbi:hypothetical protein [Streptomyces sp. NPDC058092]|uniref:hypothetical protein n=1 Tax=Streptomyces sp. NPDC058092 TaxID=3346336 RepID=UPI0036E9EB06
MAPWAKRACRTPIEARSPNAAIAAEPSCRTITAEVARASARHAIPSTRRMIAGSLAKIFHMLVREASPSQVDQ